MIYVLVGGPRDGQYVDDVPRGYRPDVDKPSNSRFDAPEGFEMLRAVWHRPEGARLRLVSD